MVLLLIFDLVSWEEHYNLLKETDFTWAKGGAFATKIIQRHDQFYWYAAGNHKTVKGSAIGVDNMVSLDSEIKKVELPDFEEGAYIHKSNGWYYLCYGYEMPEKVAYVMSRNIHGPWEFKGILNEIAGNCATNRPCIIDLKGKSYFFITMAD